MAINATQVLSYLKDKFVPKSVKPVTTVSGKTIVEDPNLLVSRPATKAEQALFSSQKAATQIREKVATPLVETVINPGSTLITPQLERYGMNNGLAFAIGLGIDILTPLPGEVKNIDRVKDISSTVKNKSVDIAKNLYDEFITRFAKFEPPKLKSGVVSPKFEVFKWEDEPAWSLSRETIERNIERVTGKDADTVKDFLLKPVRENETKRVEFLNNTIKFVKENIVNKLGIRANSLEDKLVQRFGEGKITLEELKSSTKNWEKVEEASSVFRNLYDDFLGKINAERVKFGYDAIPKRKDYFRHFEEMTGFVNQFGFIFKSSDLPTEISGLTQIFKPGKPFSTTELARKGKTTAESAIKGLENYLEAASKQMFHIDSVQRVRALEKFIRFAGKEDLTKLPNFVSNLREYGNILSGSKSAIDKTMVSYFGEGLFKGFDWLRKRTNANLIAGNISSAISNYIPLTQSLATTSKPKFIKGLFEAVFSPLRNTDFDIISGVQSKFLKRRYPEKYIDPRGFEKGLQYANWLFESVDKFVAKAIVSGKYFENISKGIDVNRAMEMADAYAGKVIADRSIGQLPNLQSTKSLSFITQFQTEVNNAMSFMIQDIPKMSSGSKARIVTKLTELSIYSYIFNSMFQNLTGRRPIIDPIHAFLTMTGNTEESRDKNLMQRVLSGSVEVGENLPYLSAYSGGRFPIQAGIPNLATIFSGNPTEKIREFIKPVFLLAPPFGGLQAKKTIEGLSAYQKGEVKSRSGKTSFKTEKNLPSLLRSIAFGRYATENAQEYFKEAEVLYSRIEQQQATRDKLYLEAENKTAELNQLSSSEAAKQFTEIQKTNPKLAEKIKTIKEDEKNGITAIDRMIKQLGVENGEKAKYIVSKLNELPTNSAKQKYYQELIDKKIITNEVSSQINYLLKK